MASAARPHTEAGTVLGTAAYMSPEQAEGGVIDARSDIFSFGCVLYEMAAGRAAFQGESIASILSAVLRDEPKPLTDAAPAQPHELGRIVTKCLRKDPARRFQGMADVRVALEDLRDDAVSGNLTGPMVVGAQARRRSWVLPAVAVASIAVAAGAVFMLLQRGRQTQPAAAELTRVSPADDASYDAPAISADRRFMAYLSDRNGNKEKKQIWLQQIGGGAPIQLTFAPFGVSSPSITPDGTHVVYKTYPGSPSAAAVIPGALEIVPLLGGQPRKLADAGCPGYSPTVSPDGSTIAYLDCVQDQYQMLFLKTIPVQGGVPREIKTYTQRRPTGNRSNYPLWHPDGRHVLLWASTNAEAGKGPIEDWVFFPIDESEPRPSGIRKVFAEAGFGAAWPAAFAGDRVLISSLTKDQSHVYSVRISSSSMQANSPPRQLTFGTGSEWAYNASSNGLAAIGSADLRSDLYFTPMDESRGVVTGPPRRLTADSRIKSGVGMSARGQVFLVYTRNGGLYQVLYRDLSNGIESLLSESPLGESTPTRLSRDGSQFLENYREGDQWSVRAGAVASPHSKRVICRQCGLITGAAPSPNSRFFFIDPGTRMKDDPARKKSIHLLDLESGKSKLWLADEKASMLAGPTFGGKGEWIRVRLEEPGAKSRRYFLVPWSENPPPASKWVELKNKRVVQSHISGSSDLFYYWEGSTLMSLRFDPATRSLSTNPTAVKPWPGSQPALQPTDQWDIGLAGIVFNHKESRSSVWTMKLPD